jgi:hypothetical protein
MSKQLQYVLEVTPTGMLQAKPHSSSVWEIVQHPACTGTEGHFIHPAQLATAINSYSYTDISLVDDVRSAKFRSRHLQSVKISNTKQYMPSTLKMEEARPSEKLVQIYKTIHSFTSHMTSVLHSHCCGNCKSHTEVMLQ